MCEPSNTPNSIVLVFVFSCFRVLFFLTNPCMNYEGQPKKNFVNEARWRAKRKKDKMFNFLNIAGWRANELVNVAVASSIFFFFFSKWRGNFVQNSNELLLFIFTLIFFPIWGDEVKTAASHSFSPIFFTFFFPSSPKSIQPNIELMCNSNFSFSIAYLFSCHVLLVNWRSFSSSTLS